MAIVGESRGLFPILKQWVKDGRPVRWNICPNFLP